MILDRNDGEKFFRLWWNLLFYANQKLDIIKDVPLPDAFSIFPSELTAEVRNKIWEEDSTILASYILENPNKLSSDDIGILKGWRKRLKNSFLVLKEYKNFTVFMADGKCYGVISLSKPISELVYAIPAFVEAVLLPFRGKIIYDSILASRNISFGAGMRKGFNAEFQEVKKRDGVILSLD
jgi:hypothetical protein